MTKHDEKAEGEEAGEAVHGEEEEGQSGSDGSSASQSSDSSDLPVLLDEDGRVPGGVADAPKPPELDYGFRSFPFLLDSSKSTDEWNLLLSDARAAFTARATKKARYSTGQTFFIKSSEEPRCSLERLAKHIWTLHTQHLVAGEDYDADRSGAEWWSLVLNQDDDVGLHWDRDYSIEADGDVHVHPHLASVTYLTGTGAPTIAFDMVGSMEGPDIDPAKPHTFRDVFLSRPRPGKHISFDGRLLHCAPADADFFSKSGSVPGPRITFLVNIWLNHVPISSERFDDLVAASLKCKTLCIDAGATAKYEEIVIVETAKEEDEGFVDMDLSFKDSGGGFVMSLSLPKKRIVKESESDAPDAPSSFGIVYASDANAKRGVTLKGGGTAKRRKLD